MSVVKMLFDKANWIKTLVGSTVNVPYNYHLYQLNDLDKDEILQIGG
ncbi:hypothetical protein [Lactobacillus sp. HT06-2]|nr:hypothetical protein [Lactobacillus sp. HT06-2]